MEESVLTFGLSIDQLKAVQKEFPNKTVYDVKDQYQDLIAVPCKVSVINTDSMTQEVIQIISNFRNECRDEDVNHCYIWSDNPKPIYNSNLWQEFVLLKRWKEHRKYAAFIYDGIVDLQTFCMEDKKLLFILRDMNHDEDDHNLCEDLEDYGSGYKTWGNVGRWIIALLDGKQEYPRDMSNNLRADQLRRVAVMNVKKEGGCSRAKRSELAEAVDNDRDYILRQIYLYQPDMIVCCGFTSSSLVGNADLLKEGDKKYNVSSVFTTKEKDSFNWQTIESQNFVNHNWWYFYVNLDNHTVPVLSFCHPQTTNMGSKRGHEDLFKPLYRDMLYARKIFLSKEPKIF